ELEKIDTIIQKIDEDPEEAEVKRIERNLWIEIRKKAEEGRSTGVGITAEGDMLAGLGIRYGSAGGNECSVNLHKSLALAADRSSVDMAIERGACAICHAKREAK